MTSPYVLKAAERAKLARPVKLEDEVWTIGSGAEGWNAHCVVDGAGIVVGHIPSIPMGTSHADLCALLEQQPARFSRPVAILHAVATVPQLLTQLDTARDFLETLRAAMPAEGEYADLDGLIDDIIGTLNAARGKK